MAKKTNEVNSSVFGNVKKLSSISSTLMNGINNNGSIERGDAQDAIARNVEDVVNNESSDIVRNKAMDYDEFIRKTNIKKNRSSSENSEKAADAQTVAEMFDSDAESIFSAFKDLYRKRNNLYDDLESIVERIFDLKEALNTTRDSIVSADELNKTISREITFDTGERLTSESGLKIVEQLEEKYKLLQKIKNNIVPSTLLYGVYYTYQVPHSHIYEDYQRRKQNMNYRNSLTESAGFSDEALLENAALDIERETELSKEDAKEILTEMSSQFTVINDPTCILESANTDYIQYKLDKGNEKSFTDRLKESRRVSKTGTGNDGVTEVEDFKDIRDCYFELLEPRKILPIRIMDETIGYYYMRNDPATTTTTNRFGEQLRKVNKGKGLGGSTDEQSLKNSVLGKMVDSIVQSFDKKFLQDNEEFKELILSSLMYDDNYNKSITFQFIPADFITEHKVNDGKSMLEPALFYGKLYMSLLIYNMFAIIGRSADQKIYWVRNSGADKNLANQVQSVARSIKKNRLNFNDLMNFNSIVGRVGTNRELFIPVGASNERGLDFDIMQGQDVDIHDEFMDGLLRKAINATGVPSVIMNYINEADYAKTLVLANAKHLERCVSYQTDFNESITEMYRSLLLYSTDMDIDAIESMKFKFSVPSGLNSMNYADLINNVDQIANFVVETTLGRNSQPTPVTDITKDVMYNKVARKYLPLDWDLMDSLFEDSRVEAEKILSGRKIEEEEGNE